MCTKPLGNVIARKCPSRRASAVVHMMLLA